MKTRLKTTRRSVLQGLAASTLASAAVAPAWAASTGRRPVVVELFTSQGCNSCPPSEDVLAALAERPDVIAVGLHVDYWDFLGWKDRLADPKHAKRQSGYNMALRRRSNFTPQMVIDGAVSATGSRGDKVSRIISKRMETPNTAVDIALAFEGDSLRIDLGKASSSMKAGKCAVHLLPYKSHMGVQIARGENAGRALNYTNAVRGLTRLGNWRGEAMSLNHAISPEERAQLDGIAVIVQDNTIGEVRGAAKITV